MDLEDKSYLVEFLTHWVQNVPWKRAIKGNEQDLVGLLCSDGLDLLCNSTGPHSHLWERLLAMHLSSLVYARDSRRRHASSYRKEGMATRETWGNFSRRRTRELDDFIRKGSKWNKIGATFGLGIVLLVQFPMSFSEDFSSKRWLESSQSLSSCELPSEILLKQIYQLAIENTKLPILLYRQLMGWMSPLSPKDECGALQRSSIELLLGRIPLCGRRQLYMLAISQGQLTISSRSRIIRLLDSVVDKARLTLRGVMLSERTLDEEACQKVVDHLLQESANKEHETLLKLVLGRERFAMRHYEDMVSWLVQEGSDSGFEQDREDWTTVRTLSLYLLDTGCFPISESTLLYAILFQNKYNYVDNLKALIILVMNGNDQMRRYDMMRHLQERTEVSVPELKEIFSHILDGLSSGTRYDLYRCAAGKRIPNRNDRDIIVWWVLGFPLEEESEDRNKSLSTDFIASLVQLLTGKKGGTCDDVQSCDPNSQDWDGGLRLLEEYIEDRGDVITPVWPLISAYKV